MKKTIVTILAVVLVLALAVGLAGCKEAAPAATPAASEAASEAPAATEAPASEAPATTEAPASEAPAASEEASAAPAGEPIKLGYIAYDMTDPWNDYSAKAFEYAATQADVPVDVLVRDSKNSVEESVKVMESLIQEEVDGISIFPISVEQGTQLVKMANDAGIPITVENFEMDPENSGDYLAAVACRYDDIGYAAMQYIAEQKPGAKVFFVAGQQGAGVYEKYQEGIDRALEELGDKISIVRTEHADWATDKAMTVTQNVIQAGEEFDYIFANNGAMAKGAYQALQDADMADIPIVSTGGSMDDYDMLEQGIEAANMTAPVNIQGVQTFKNIYEFVKDGTVPAEKFQPLPVIPVSATDLAQFIKWDDYAAAYEYVS